MEIKEIIEKLKTEDRELLEQLKNKSFAIGFQEGVNWGIMSDLDKAKESKELMKKLNEQGTSALPKIDADDTEELKKGIKAGWEVAKKYKKKLKSKK